VGHTAKQKLQIVSIESRFIHRNCSSKRGPD
jgi:hypothetical protein